MAEHKSGLTLRGMIVEENPEAIALRIGHSVFQIQRGYVESMREIEETSEGRLVEAKIAANAHIIQRVLASAALSAAARLPILAAACQCACNCNCACECACSSGGSRERPEESSAFRSRLNAESAAGLAAA